MYIYTCRSVYQICFLVYTTAIPTDEAMNDESKGKIIFLRSLKSEKLPSVNNEINMKKMYGIANIANITVEPNKNFVT